MLALALLFSASASISATNRNAFDGKIISGVKVMGNEKTRDFVILREMKTAVGDHFSAERIEADRKRIQNLALFTRVEIIPAAADHDTISLFVIVAERWPFFPYPLLFRNERAWDKWSYGLGIIHNNIKGLNQKLLAELWLGYNPGGQLVYSNPWFGGDHHYYHKLQILKMDVLSKSLHYPRFVEQHEGMNYTFGKRWNYHVYTSAAVFYDHIVFPAEYSHLLTSNRLDQDVPSFGLGFRYDTRDLYEYPKSGWLIDAYATITYFPRQLNYLIYGGDFRHYFHITELTSLAMKFAIDLSAGQVPIYAHQFLGYRDRIRGHFNEQREGENRALFGAEFRFPILPIRYLNLQYGDISFGTYSNNLPFGVSGGIFVDAGDVWWNQPSSNSSGRLAGFGAGLHIHLPYVELLRIEYAFSFRGEPEIIFDLQVAF